MKRKRYREEQIAFALRQAEDSSYPHSPSGRLRKTELLRRPRWRKGQL